MFAPKARAQDELQALLRPIRKKLERRTWARQLTAYGLCGLGGSVALLLVARLWPIPYYSWVVIALPSVALLCGWATGYRKKPSVLDSARTADANGLAQRVVTAWENRDNSSRIAAMQRADALQHLRRTLPQAVESVRVWGGLQKRLYAGGALLAAGVLLFCLPNPQDLRLAQMAQEKKSLAQAEEKLDEAKEELQNDKEMSKTEKQQLAQLLEQTKKTLAAAKDPAERQNALRAAQKQLDKWKEIERKRQAALQQLQNNLGSQEGTRALADAMKSGNMQELEKALKQAAEQMEKMFPSQRDALAKELAKSAEQLGKEAATAKSLEPVATQLAQAAQQLSQGQVPQAMAAMESGLMSAMGGTQQAGPAMLALSNAATSLQQAQMMLASSGGAGAGGAGAPAGTASPGQAVPASGVPAGTSAGDSAANAGQGAAGQPGNGGAGQGNGSGQGSGSGQGNGNGNGSGSGSGSGSGRGAGSGKGGGAGLGTGSHELVTVPSARIGGNSGPTDTVGGPLGAGPSQSRQSQSTQVSAGGALPYEEVYGQYEQFARESMEKGNIPGDYQEVVKQYFSNIEP